MLSDEFIQADIIAKLKTITTVTSLLTNGASDIKELQWQGDTFKYPAVRLDLERTEYEFDEQEKCNLYNITFSVYIFSEERSSKQCSQIKGLLENYLSGLGWTGTYCKFNRLRLQENVPAVREDENTWRGQLQYACRVQPV